jgi:mono/diheme cytochrome c family protein
VLPEGNAQAGRKVFLDLGCHSCHEVKGEHFPQTPASSGNVGPELTGMGAFHPAEDLAESIVNPNAVILEGPGFIGPDGLSKMPSFDEDMTVAQLIDLVTYLKNLTSGGPHHTPPTIPAGPQMPPPMDTRGISQDGERQRAPMALGPAVTCSYVP